MTREEWIAEVKRRLQAGEDALSLTIEKYQRVLEGMTLHTGFEACALCHVFFLSIETEDSDCGGCPVDAAGENCTNSFNGIEKKLWRLNGNPALHDARDDFVANVVLPFLEGLRDAVG